MNLHKLQMENIQAGRDDLKKIIEKGKRNRKQALHPETLITRRYPTKFADIYGGISQQESKKVKAGLKVAENVQGIDQRDMLIRDDKMRKQGMRSSAACAPDAKDTDNDERIDLSDIKAPGVIRVTMKAATMRAMGTR